jgi:hypothetical protein
MPQRICVVKKIKSLKYNQANINLGSTNNYKRYQPFNAEGLLKTSGSESLKIKIPTKKSRQAALHGGI